MRLAAVLLVAWSLLPLAWALPAAGDCHLPPAGHCDGVGQPRMPSCTNTMAPPASCTTSTDNKDDEVRIALPDLDVEGMATPRGLPAHPSAYETGTLVDLTLTFDWSGEAAADVEVYFAARPGLDWVSAGGATVGSPRFFRYTLNLTPDEPATVAWTARIWDNATGPALLDLAVAYHDARGVEQHGEATVLLEVVDRLPGPPAVPFWQDPAFILMLGMVIGLSVGYVLFGKPRQGPKRS
ncbi:MAG: hypothetical protein QOD77_364 [Thermoplasmata archaeon]|jgi:hypothetical protein|nr:hypothetical protein [Thermoplasmata archaeon]